MGSHTARHGCGTAQISILDTQARLLQGIARFFALALALTGALMLGQNKLAYAKQGSLVIASTSNQDARYVGYLLFEGSDTGAGTLSDLTWTTAATRDVTLGVLRAQGYDSWLAEEHPHARTTDAPQLAAEYLSQQLGGVQSGTVIPRNATGAATALANDLARALRAHDDITSHEARAGLTFTGPQGYWVFFSAGTSAQAGTTPLFVLLGDDARQVEEKAGAPRLTAFVFEDSTQSWESTADARRTQVVPHRLVGTLPHTFASFEQYHYQMSYTLPKGMTYHSPGDSPAASEVEVYVDGRRVTPDDSELTISCQGSELKVDCANLKSAFWQELGVNASSVLEVHFGAALNDQSTTGAAGNVGTARLTYTRDPVSNDDASLAPVSTAVFTYSLALQKQDATTHRELEGATFCLEELSPVSGEASEGTAAPKAPGDHRYLQKDGSLGPEPYAFTTDRTGLTSIVGIDEGRYLITETSAPKGFQALAQGIEIRVSAKRDNEGLTVTSLEATLDAKEASLSQVDATSGVINLFVQNQPLPNNPTTPDKTESQVFEQLAQTGVGPLALVLVSTGLLLKFGGASLRRRKEA